MKLTVKYEINYKIGDLIKVKKKYKQTTNLYFEALVKKGNDDFKLNNYIFTKNDIIQIIDSNVLLVLDTNALHKITTTLQLKILYKDKVYFSAPQFFEKVY